MASIVGAAETEALAARGIEATNVAGRVTAASLAALSVMLEAGEMVAPTIRTFTLADAGDALSAVATGHVRGKVAVAVQ